MKKKILYLLTFVGLHLTSEAQINTGSPAKPFNSNTKYAYGIMPGNLPTGGTYGKSTDAAEAYTTWKSKYVKACGSNFRVGFDNINETVSEGIAYGMLLSVYAGDKPLFDGLWGYYKANTNGKFMHWKIGGCSGILGANGATDAELDAAMALIVAEDQWPSASIDYIKEAKDLIGLIKQYEMDPNTKQTWNGDGWPQGNNRDCRNPSYFSPAYYREFARVTGDAFWTGAADVSDTYLIKNRNANTGLVSNWSDPNATPNDCNNTGLEYGYDACRNPWRMATDVLWHGAGTAKAGTDICNKIANWASGDIMNKFKGPRDMAGAAKSQSYANGTFLSTFTVGLMGTSDDFMSDLEEGYDKTVALNLQYEKYFGETLRALMLFVMSGNFWKPGDVQPPKSIVTVSLTAPLNNASVSKGTEVTISATASSTNGATISKVEFSVDGTVVNTDNASPFTYAYSTSSLTVGKHTITAKATDSNGSTETSSVSIDVTAVTNPSVVTVNLTSPTGTDYAVGAPITLSATASSTNGATITKVEFYVDNTLVNSDAASPYEFSATNLAVGAHTIYAKAYDSNSQTASTTQKTINVKSVVTPSQTVDMLGAASAPVIDGTIDEVWKSIPSQSVAKVTLPTVTNAADLSATFKTIWDSQNAYVLVEVTDDAKVNDSGNDFYNDDAVEVYFDLGNEKASAYDNNDVQYTFRWNDNTVHAGPSGRSSANVQFKMIATATGYLLEASFPWSTLQGTVATGKNIGFDVQVNDDDNSGSRDGKIAWSASEDNAWENASVFGTAVLKPTGLEDVSFGGMKVYPNPFNATLTIDGLHGATDYSIVDLSGKVIQSGSTSGTIETHFEPGMYNLMLRSNATAKVYNVKLVKVR